MVLDSLRLRKEALANQWLPRSELYSLQFRKLKGLLSHAYENVPFYRARFKELGVDPNDIQSIADLRKIPTVTKDHIRNTPLSQLISREVSADSCKKVSTSGTTGAPVTVMVDDNSVGSRAACVARVRDAIGLDPWDHGAVLNFMGSRNRDSSLKDRLASWALRRKNRYSRQFYFTYDSTEILDDLMKFEPKVVDAQPSYLRNLMNALKRTGKFLDLKMTISDGDILDSATRREIELFFGCPTYDFYGTRETGPLAWQCKSREGFHMNIDTHVFEFIDEEGSQCSPGEEGTLVVTCLDNHAFPLVRYEIRDVASYEDSICSCGRSLPLITNIEGRISDFLTLSDKKRISPRKIVSSMREIADLPSFQLAGTGPDEVTVRLFSETVPDQVIQRVVTTCGELVENKLKIKVALMTQEPKAKLRCFVPYQQAKESIPPINQKTRSTD